MVDYSQFGEQDVILRACQHIARDRSCFLDIGAWNATTFSNTRALFELGWGGVLIEPSPIPMAGLLQEYGNESRIKLVQAAVSCEAGIEEMWVTPDGTSTGDHAIYEQWKDGIAYTGRLIVPRLRLADISNMFGGFDMISIDVEGHSADLALQLHALNWEPHCLVVEHDNRMTELCCKASERSYDCVLANGTNAVFVRRG